MKLLIKNMVSLRCKMIVKEKLKKLGLHAKVIDLGIVEISEDITKQQWEKLKVELLSSGLELQDDRKKILVEKIKKTITKLIDNSDELPKLSYSQYLSDKLGYDYNYLSNLFSEIHGDTVQHFISIYKIEKVKELLSHEELTLMDISYKLHYSSVAHLCNHFKKVSGHCPSFYRQLKQNSTQNLENTGISNKY